MAISYPLVFPTNIYPNDFVWNPMSAVAKVESIFTYTSKVYAWSGQKRFFVAKFADLTFDQWRDLKGFSRKLNGREGTFFYGDPNMYKMRGSVASGYAGAAVQGAGQLGNSIVTKGWPASQTVLRVGDWTSIGNRLYEMMDDAVSNGSGSATLSLWPSVRTAYADNAVISVGDASQGVFRLTGFPSEEINDELFMVGFSITAEEDL